MDWYVKQVREESAVAKKVLTDAGIEFEEHPQFVAYVIIDGDCYLAKDCAEAIREAQGTTFKDSPIELIKLEVDEKKPELEICNNEEWLRVYGGYTYKDKNDEGEEGDEEFNASAFDEYVENVKSMFDEEYTDFVAAKGQRIMCHGWNGAHFTYRNGGIGTFDVLTESAEAKFNTI